MSPSLLLIPPSSRDRWVIWGCGATMGSPGDTLCLCFQPHFSKMRLWCLQIVMCCGSSGRLEHVGTFLQARWACRA